MHLPKQLRIMLNALAAQHFGEFLSDEDKRAALEKLLADIEHDQYPQQYDPAPHFPHMNANKLNEERS